MAQDEMSSEPRPVPVNNTDDDQAKIQSYEEAFRQIKEATGVSDTQASVLMGFFCYSM